ncbi:hypothetical protein PVK06_022785 [Gossypium arboreum]|uniref:Uncharacterized protein n=1 Tax=Gossypium arboreum TaxID=29729 RepID=A0ABR0P9J9_GOSAR|nr:hypothetical protein PVK06_022785 [Gossypium arboreum]
MFSSILGRKLKLNVLSLLVRTKVKDMVTEEGAWNLEAFRDWLPEEIVRKIASIPPPHPQADPDKFFWIYTSNGGFSVKSAYRMENGRMSRNSKAHGESGFSYG